MYIQLTVIGAVAYGDVTQRDGSIATVSFSEDAIFWIGPAPASLVLMGAKFTPCMRSDVKIASLVIQPQHDAELGYGCCMQQGGGVCFSGPHSACTGAFQQWSSRTCGGSQCCINSQDTSPGRDG